MELIPDNLLENSAVVANCRMNRERDLRGNNGYEVELRFDPLEYLTRLSNEVDSQKTIELRWLDLCCGTGKALGQAADLIESEELPIKIVGVDLVGMFLPSKSEKLRLEKASLREWCPDANTRFDLITCVHGLHYLGDKLSMISRFRSWLSENGRFAANLDPENIRVQSRKSSRVVLRWLRQVGFQVSTPHKLIQCEGAKLEAPPFDYLGADQEAGPNYTGQPAVNSHYKVKLQD